MTKIFLVSALALLATAANASSLKITSDRLYINSKFETSSVAVTTVDERKKKMTLTLVSFECVTDSSKPSGSCQVKQKKLMEFSVPLLKKSTNYCGSVMYSGSNNVPDNGADFPVRSITVTDNSKNFCEANLEALYIVEATNNSGNTLPSFAKSFRALSNSADIVSR